MKTNLINKSTTIFGVFCSLLIASCTAVENDINPSINESSAVQSLSARNTNSMVLTVNQLISTYKDKFGSEVTSLENHITRLNVVANNNMFFNQIKTETFVIPSVNEVDSFMGDNLDSSLSNLNLSVKMKSYIDTILESNDNYELLIPSIETDEELTSSEKYSLLFIVNHFYNTYSNGNGNGGGTIIEDWFWTKRNVIAALEGFEKSDANAVFNVALCSIAK